MERCSPVEMRKNLEVVQQFTKAGIDFVAVPVLSDIEKVKMYKLMNRKLDEMEKESEQ